MSHWIGVPFPGGWTIGTLLLINVLAAHATRFKLTWECFGIIVLHAGVIVLMLGELCTGLFAVEGNMTIPSGTSANYIEHMDDMELDVIDPTDAKTDDVVTVIPAAMLHKGGLIRNELLPFDVKVERDMANSAEPVAPKPGEPNPATAGFGLKAVAVPKDAGVGVDMDQKVDMPSAYVTLLKKGTDESLGTYFVSAYWDMMGWDAQKVEAGGRKFQLDLRPRREYKPYTIKLLEFTHSVYPGTEIPKDFSSRIRLLDKATGEDPAYCNVTGHYVDSLAGITGSPNNIGFQLALPDPAVWNGKFLFLGNGGFAGSIQADVTLGFPYATAATDAGHQSTSELDGSWALNNQLAQDDVGYRGVHFATLVNQDLTRSYYANTAPTQSYFDGCSDGGREALVEAEQFPTDFNGIVAGDPAIGKPLAGFNWNDQALLETIDSWRPADQPQMVDQAVMNECDSTDGVIDGLIQDPRRCNFDPATLQGPRATVV